MEIYNAILTDVVELDDNRKMSLRGLIPGIIIAPFEPSELTPYVYSFSCIFILRTDENDMDGHTSQIEIIDPHGGVLINHENVPIRRGELTPDMKNDLGIATIGMGLDARNVTFKAPGKYTVRLTVDGAETKDVSFVLTVRRNDE